MTDALTLPSVTGPVLGSPHPSYLCRSCHIRRGLALDHPHRSQGLFAFDAWTCVNGVDAKFEVLPSTLSSYVPAGSFQRSPADVGRGADRRLVDLVGTRKAILGFDHFRVCGRWRSMFATNGADWRTAPHLVSMGLLCLAEQIVRANYISLN